MRQTPLRIPLEAHWSLGPLGEARGFGLGIVLFLWLAFGAWWLWRNTRTSGFRVEFWPPIVGWTLVATIIVLLPRLLAPDSLRIEAVLPHPTGAQSMTEVVEISNPTSHPVSL